MSSIGSYGNKRPADVNPADIEVVVIFNKTRNSTDNQVMRKYNGADVIRPILHNDETGGNTVEILGGLYNLKLPKELFNQKGFYTVYIRPAQIRVDILDCGELINQPGVKGLVFDVNSVPSEFLSKFTNNGLTGFRVEYLNRNGTKMNNMFRMVTSSFLVEPISDNNNNLNQKAVKYNFNDGGSLLYASVTPNVAPSFRPTTKPFIGNKGQTVILTNTFFNPIMLDIEMVDYDMESLAYALYGNQTKSIDDGIYTIYDFDNEIFAQYDLFEIRDSESNPLYEVRRKRSDDNIDTDKGFDNITNS